MTGNYILNADNEPVQTADIVEWAKWFESADRTVQQTQIGECRVSTVFWGVDHRFGEAGAPLLFETMVLVDDAGHPLRGEIERYCTWDEAEAGHKIMCERVREVCADAT